MSWALLVEDNNEEVALPVALATLEELFSKVVKDAFDEHDSVRTVVDELCDGLDHTRIEVSQCTPVLDHQYTAMVASK